ncbi:5-formyltetrahydrofolate cyclo-ligase [Streptococcus plurextorum]|uniref:5-formyltetrahydrofolate cyclo-ligase n=1 Tax=Streptococcus plurextorum TaxID=456876 RepID=UPI00048584E5|nr:5-formyltetrahydrofolate cyclo-ligase [Streptococcus plurextorum]
MTKKEIRNQVLKDLKAMDQTHKACYDRDLAGQFWALEAYQKAKVIALYLAFSHEFNTQLLIDQALSDGKKILVPKTYSNGRMIFVAYDKERLYKTSFGLWEPLSHTEVMKSRIDLILVPGLAFNTSGYRIGYGGGYYDRYLEDYQGETISLAYPFQALDFQPDGFDVPVKEVMYATI